MTKKNYLNIKQFPSKYQENVEGDLLTTLGIADRLNAQDILDIAEGRRLAVRIPQFCKPQIAKLGAKRIINDSAEKLGTYQNASIDYLGQPFYDTNASQKDREIYYQTATNNPRGFREIFSPYQCPSDTLRVELDEFWTCGARVLEIGGRKMSSATCRVFRPGGLALPHQDVLEWDAPFEPNAKQFSNQLTALVYLEMPEVGGEVELWDKRYSESDYNKYRLGETYGLDKSLIPEPDFVIKPSVGDLLIWNASKVHAVRETVGGIRITISSFIGYSGRYQPLYLWQ
ncbi:MAG: 2OG-Fe(II) oxygenase [Pyrinomonadaceae bacterium]|nr:2OG-Fe(II) oxygenase [Pyrinomonadaceae bacterium]